MKKQYAALPYRLINSGTEILLITTRRKGKWSVPKGWPMKGQSAPHAAAIEAFEEAGVVGKMSARKVGRFKHRKTKGAKAIRCAVDVFSLAVHDKFDNWPEKHQRKRRWFAAEEAIRRVRKKGLRRAIDHVLLQL